MKFKDMWRRFNSWAERFDPFVDWQSRYQMEDLRRQLAEMEASPLAQCLRAVREARRERARMMTVVKVGNNK